MAKKTTLPAKAAKKVAAKKTAEPGKPAKKAMPPFVKKAAAKKAATRTDRKKGAY